MITFHWNNFEFHILQYGKGTFEKDMIGHSHSANSYELHYITEGEGTLTTAHDTYCLKNGDFFVTGPNVYHQQSTSTKYSLQEIFVYLQGSGKKTKNSLVSTFLNTPFYFCNKKDLSGYFEEIVKEQTKQRIGYESAISGIVQILMTQITRLYLPEYSGHSINNDNLNDNRFLIIEKEFIQNPISITLSSLSETIGVCERQTQRLLKKYYGKTFTEKKKEAEQSVMRV